MKISFFPPLLAPAIVLVSACTNSVVTAPWIKVSELNAVAYSYTLGSLKVSENDLCVFDPEGTLFVFSEVVTPLPENQGIHATDIDVKIGENFQGGEPLALPNGFKCGIGSK